MKRHGPSPRLPVDRLADLWPGDLDGLRVGAILHAASTTSDLRPTLSVLEELAASGRISLAALFGPQHGFLSTTQDNMVEWEGFRHPRLGIPVHSLYGEHRKPTPEMLSGVDVLFLDLVDVGARYYTFIWTMWLAMEAAAEAGLPMIVADRPNPIDGVTVEGRPQREDHLSFVGLLPIPIRHGRGIGELALEFRDRHRPDLDLRVLPVEGWDRSRYLDETGLPWVTPSPNMATIETAVVYPGMCLLEGTNVSEARGTTHPFEWFGAPWIDGERLTRRLEDRGLPGVRFREIAFEPGFQKYSGEVCRGCQLHVRDRRRFRPVESALAILEVIREDYPDDFRWKDPPYEYEHEKLPIEILCGRPLGEIDSTVA